MRAGRAGVLRAGGMPPCACPHGASVTACLFREVNIYLQGRSTTSARVGARQNPPVLCRSPARGRCRPGPWEPGWGLSSHPQILTAIYSSPTAARPGGDIMHARNRHAHGD